MQLNSGYIVRSHRPATHILQLHCVFCSQFSRHEATLNLEIKRLQSEVRLERTKISGLEVQLEGARKKVGPCMQRVALVLVVYNGKTQVGGC
jgi:hypothetical protein